MQMRFLYIENWLQNEHEKKNSQTIFPNSHILYVFAYTRVNRLNQIILVRNKWFWPQPLFLLNMLGVNVEKKKQTYEENNRANEEGKGRGESKCKRENYSANVAVEVVTNRKKKYKTHIISVCECVCHFVDLIFIIHFNWKLAINLWLA